MTLDDLRTLLRKDEATADLLWSLDAAHEALRKWWDPPTLPDSRITDRAIRLERGVHPRVVQERLGHSTIAITPGIYSHVSPTLHDEAAQLVADVVMPHQA